MRTIKDTFWVTLFFSIMAVLVGMMVYAMYRGIKTVHGDVYTRHKTYESVTIIHQTSDGVKFKLPTGEWVEVNEPYTLVITPQPNK